MPITNCTQKEHLRGYMWGFILSLALCLVGTVSSAQGQNQSSSPSGDDMPLTTSLEARQHYRNALVLYENIKISAAINELQAATQLDPNFAVAHAVICAATTDPVLEGIERSKAKATAQYASAPEQLLVRWIVSVHENDFLGGIAAMNDLLSQYPRDLGVAFVTARWAMRQAQYEVAQRILLHSLDVDPNFAPAMNELAYTYVFTYNYEKAIAMMAKCTRLAPNEPNPEDSFGEVERLAGDFSSSLQHFRKSLQIDPKFYLSELGLGDTYSVMGQEETARAEYAKAIAMTDDVANKLEFGIQSAGTYVRENKLAEADRAFTDVIKAARAAHMGIWESTAYWNMALYQRDTTQALSDLLLAEASPLNDKGTARSSLYEERGRILRLRVERQLASGNMKAASGTLKQLEKLYISVNNNVVEADYHGAAGAVLFQQKKYAEAVSHLEQDPYSPRTMRLLITAYEKTGDPGNTSIISARLAGCNVASVEQAMVVPQFRAEK
jgi:tetratricopeptide (TPR) repeat protein